VAARRSGGSVPSAGTPPKPPVPPQA